MSSTRSLLLFLFFAVSLSTARQRRIEVSDEFDPPMPWAGYPPGYLGYPAAGYSGAIPDYTGYYNPNPYYSGYYPAYTMRRAYVYPSYTSYPYYGLSPYKSKKTA